jgi:peptidoglycan LD-endopeptidase LytH
MPRSWVWALLLVASPAWGFDKLVWPTPNTAWLDSKPIADFVQNTGSGDPTTGLFGCVRTDGTQFHEGIDLLPVKRDKRGEPLDPVFAVEAGTVVYISNRPGYSNYGRYIVIEHREDGLVYQTLYAHLASIAPEIAAGTPVSAGQPIAIMGHSAGNGIPVERAHLHLEFNIRLSDNFAPWYTQQKFGAPNRHGNFNGFNFIGWNALDFYNAYRAGKVTTMADYLKALPTGVVAIVRTTQTPWFIQRNYALMDNPLPASGVQGWQIEFTQEGLPKRWTPLATAPKAKLTLAEGPTGECSCRRLIASTHKAGRDLKPVLELLFGGKF